MRIIGGVWRRRVLSWPKDSGIRPTPNRVRETLFNWLRFNISQKDCLDLFAGTGSLSFEALSQGAATATAVEQDPMALCALQHNQTVLKAHTLQIVAQDALAFLRHTPPHSYHLVFLDPPFLADYWPAVLSSLVQGSWLHEDHQVYIERPIQQNIELQPGWRTLKESTAGAVRFGLYHYEGKNT